MNRVPKKLVYARLQALGDALGIPVSEEYLPGSLTLSQDFNGHTIYLRDSDPDKRSISEPFGCGLYTLAELEKMINFALRCIQIDRQGGDPYRTAQYWPSDRIRVGTTKDPCSFIESGKSVTERQVMKVRKE